MNLMSLGMMDMVAFSCCVYDGGRKELEEMIAARERSWKGKFTKPSRVLQPGVNRVNGKCPLTPLEMVVGSMLSIIHVYSTYEEMRVAPISKLNSQQTSMIVEDFLKLGNVSRPEDLRYKEDLRFPGSDKRSGKCESGLRFAQGYEAFKNLKTERKFSERKVCFKFLERQTWCWSIMLAVKMLYEGG